MEADSDRQADRDSVDSSRWCAAARPGARSALEHRRSRASNAASFPGRPGSGSCRRLGTLAGAAAFESVRSQSCRLARLKSQCRWHLAQRPPELNERLWVMGLQYGQDLWTAPYKGSSNIT